MSRIYVPNQLQKRGFPSLDCHRQRCSFSCCFEFFAKVFTAANHDCLSQQGFEILSADKSHHASELAATMYLPPFEYFSGRLSTFFFNMQSWSAKESCEPNAIKLSRCVQLHVFHVNRMLSSCRDEKCAFCHAVLQIPQKMGPY